jgi:hypothetical protein
MKYTSTPDDDAHSATAAQQDLTGRIRPACIWELSDDILELVARALAGARSACEREARCLHQTWLASWIRDERDRMDDSMG